MTISRSSSNSPKDRAILAVQVIKTTCRLGLKRPASAVRYRPWPPQSKALVGRASEAQTQLKEVACTTDRSRTLGIMSHAIAALAMDRPAQINITIRNPKTNPN
jgi:hypothetical protein